MSENTIPNELETRRMIADCAASAARHAQALLYLFRRMTTCGLNPDEITKAIMARIEDDSARQTLEPLAAEAVVMHAYLYSGADPGLAGIAGGMKMFQNQLDNRHAGMRKTLDRLFAEAPKLQNPDGSPVQGQAPALPEVAVHLASGHEMQGVLSVTEDGMYRMMSVAMQGHSRIMVESFFDLEDIDCVALARRTETSPAPLIVGGRS